MQLSHAGHGIELDKIATACDFDYTEAIYKMSEVEQLRQPIHSIDSLNFVTIKISSEAHSRTIPSRDGVYIKNRFRTSLGFSPN